MKVGVFDSGLGGRLVLDAIRERMPQYDYIYYGDTENLPYGDKTEEEIRALTRRAVLELFARDVALIIIACNTASAESLRALQEELIIGPFASRRILGVIIPTIETLIERGAERTLLIGTRRTVGSGKYVSELMKRQGHHVELISSATPELVPLIESGDIENAQQVLDGYIAHTVGKGDTLILGCTHYTVLKEYIRRTYSGLDVVSQDEIIPEKLELYLTRHPELEVLLSRQGTMESILTGK